MARWSNTHCPNAVCLAGTELIIGTFNEEGRGSDWFPDTFLGNDRSGKTNKAAKYQPSKWDIEGT